MKITGRYRILVLMFTIAMVIFTATRTILLFESLSELDVTLFLLIKIYAVGFLFDFATCSYMLIPIILLMIFMPEKLYNSRLSRGSKQVVFFLFLYFMLFYAFAESVLARDLRGPHHLFFALIFLLILTIILFIPVSRYITRTFPALTSFKQRLCVGILLLFFPLISFFTIDLSLTQISPSNYANELTGNGFYNLGSAIIKGDIGLRGSRWGGNFPLVMANLNQEGYEL
ncbi:MAG: hypothetical protein FWD70_04005 [Desulfuromonadales bacterium]|nr:hypothetical protein [Desulfuromonadales bacterium]